MLGSVAASAAMLLSGVAVADAAAKKAPGNDNFANAYTMTGYEAAASGSNVGATAEAGEPGGSTPLNTVWWKWTAPRTGQATFDTYGSDLTDAYLCVYSGSSLTGLYNLGCDDDGGLGLSSAFRAPVNKGQTYYLQVDGYGSHVGSIVARARFAMCNGVPATIDMVVDGQNGTPGDDVIAGTEGPDVIDGGGGNDMICAYKGNDTLGGGAGNDVIEPGPGNDIVNGGTGTDTLKYSDGKASITFNLANTAVQFTGGSGSDRASYMENIIGTSASDLLYGTAGNNTLTGGGGNDRLYGGAGNDFVDAGGGTDYCDGGSGYDSQSSCETRVGFP